jgi:hypothetical protein
MKKIIISISIILTSLIISSCIEENPALVNPPSKVDRVYVRFINLASDYNSRYLTFDGMNPTNNVDYATSSVAFHPPSDSATLSIRNSNSEYTLPRLIKFSRDVYYSFFALPSAMNSQNYRNVDTIITLSTSLTMPDNSEDAYIKLFNAFPDSSTSFSLTIGCPNSKFIFSNIRYKNVTSPVFIRTGTVPISIIQTNNSKSDILGTYSVNIKAKGQYAIVILQDKNGNPDVYFLDELNLQSEALSPAQFVIEKNSTIRMVNLSSSYIDAIKNPANPIANNIAENYISHYATIKACDSPSLDSIIINSNNNYASSISYSFEVLKNYSIIVADSSNTIAKKIVIVPPLSTRNFNNKSIIRCVNLAWNYTELDVALSSRKLDTANGFSAGEVLARKLQYGQVGNEISLVPGSVPISVFGSSAPFQMLTNAMANLESNKDYLLILTNDDNGNVKLSLVESTTENQQITFLQNTSFVQIINAISRTQSVSLSVGNLIPSATLFYNNILATNLPTSNIDINFSINGQNKTINLTPDVNSRYSIILCGDKENPDYIVVENPIQDVNLNIASIRFINASNSLNAVSVTDNIQDPPVFFAELNFKSSTFYYDLNKAKRYSYYFYDTEKITKLANIDFDITFGKKYTIIFAGTNKDNFGYNIMMMQDY